MSGADSYPANNVPVASSSKVANHDYSFKLRPFKSGSTTEQVPFVAETPKNFLRSDAPFQYTNTINNQGTVLTPIGFSLASKRETRTLPNPSTVDSAERVNLLGNKMAFKQGALAQPAGAVAP